MKTVVPASSDKIINYCFQIIAENTCTVYCAYGNALVTKHPNSYKLSLQVTWPTPLTLKHIIIYIIILYIIFKLYKLVSATNTPCRWQHILNGKYRIYEMLIFFKETTWIMMYMFFFNAGLKSQNKANSCAELKLAMKESSCWTTKGFE